MAVVTATSTEIETPLEPSKAVEAPKFKYTEFDYIDSKTGLKKVSEEKYKNSSYPEWLPTWDPNQKLAPIPDDLSKNFVDRGHFADKGLKNLFPPKSVSVAGVKVRKLTPKLGSEVHGVQLSELSDDAKNDLALFVAQRGVVVFRNQNLRDKGLQFNKEFGEYFGPLHVHPSSGAPEGFDEFHLVYTSKGRDQYKRTFADKLSLRQWHSDISFEKYPAGTTFFAVLDGPSVGGDTLFSDTVEAYNRLSPTFQELISGLTATHSSKKQAAGYRAIGGLERRTPSKVSHLLVRIHPVTKQKSLYVSGFIEQIDGLKKEE